MRFFAVAALLVTPALVFAAGFAPQSIFLSQSPVTEGETVRIYAIVTNESSVTFAGKVVLKEADVTIGSVPVSLAVGATQTASTPWTPSAGSHTIVADLVATDGTVAEEKSETFDIQAKPQPEETTAALSSPAAVGSSQGIQNSIGSVSPQVESAIAPAFTYIDSLRNDAAGVINNQIAATKPKVTSSPVQIIDGTGTQTPSTSGWLWSIVYTIYFYILTLLSFIVDTAGVFYPLLAFIFLYFLWRMYRRFRRA